MTAPDPSGLDTALTAERSAWQAYASAQYGAGASLQASKDALVFQQDQTTIDGLNSQVAALQEELFELQHPMTLAVDISSNAEPTVPLSKRRSDALGQFGGSLGPHVKFFDGARGPQVAVGYMTESGYGTAPGEVDPILCFKRLNTTDQTYLTTRAASLTKPELWCWRQEPEDDIARGELTVADYQAGFVTLDKIRKASPHPELIRLVACLNIYQETDKPNSTRNWQALLTGIPLDVVGLDVYDAAFYPASWDPSKYLSDGPAAAKALGIEWWVTEFGAVKSTKTQGDTDQAAAQRALNTITWARANGCKHFAYWWDSQWAYQAVLSAFASAMQTV